MREIKFRAWNETAEGCQMVTQKNSGLTSGEILHRYSLVMQFTGLHDRSGTPIYEGDVLTVVNDEYGSPMPNVFTGEVTYMEGGFYVDNQKDNAFPVWQEIAEWEVIGNIYENPDLL